MRILVVSPSAPPKNSPESIQVGRYLSELLKRNRISLVTTPVERGWVRADNALSIRSDRLHEITLRLPLHAASTRALHSRWLRRLAWPDQDYWIVWLIRSVVRALPELPDVIYSRSGSLSAAILSRRLAQQLGRPWVMHLSDPWADSPYRSIAPRNLQRDLMLEAECFKDASLITLTTRSQLGFYAEKYPEHASKLALSRNVPETLNAYRGEARKPGPLKVVYTGALYRSREPTALLRAVEKLIAQHPEHIGGIEVIFVGNIDNDILAKIQEMNLPSVRACGPVGFSEAAAYQKDADILVSIEPDGSHPLIGAFFPSKLLDYAVAGKPVLAITPRDSEAWRWCGDGYGWAFEPSDLSGLCAFLHQAIVALKSGRWEAYWHPPAIDPVVGVQSNVLALESRMLQLVAGNPL